MLIPHEEADPADRLDDLFAELKAAPDEESATRLERRIVVTMMNSGSETVDLLMSWATESIMEEDYPLALDFLDSVVMMAPDFAEGWNRRATVHFRMGDFGPALDDIQRTLTLEPRHFQAIAGLGIILRQLDRPEQALTAFHRALEIHPFLEGVADAIKDLEEDYSREI
jgi:tetratricopeptide (TPR) repeat protein